MITNFTPKNPKKYECIKCNFITSNKKDYTRHLTTAKHKMVTNDNKKPQKNPKAFCAYIVIENLNIGQVRVGI